MVVAVTRPRSRSHYLASVALATARLWRGLSYDEAIAVAGAARGELELGRPPKGRRIVDRLTRPELDRLLDHAYRVRGLYGLMVRTMVLTGARVSEFVALVDADVNLDDCEITIRHGKGGKARVVPILPELGRELRLHLDMGGRRGSRVYGPLFQTRSWRAFSRRRVQAIVKELAAGAGISKRVYPHLLRHTIAQHLTDRGMPLDQVQRFLGHAKIDTTQIYAESSTAAIRTSYRKALE